jgi:hypothetical protein
MYFVAKPNEEAKSFIQAAGLIDETQIKAIGTLVFDLKNYNIWDKMKAIYPFVGGTSGSHKFNLKDPRDTNAAYRLAFTGTWSHTNTGATPAGGFANTYLNASASLNINSAHYSYYSRTQTTADQVEMGAYPSGYAFGIELSISRNSSFVYSINSLGASTSNNDSLGHFISSRTASTALAAYKDGNSIANSTRQAIGIPDYNIYLASANEFGNAFIRSTKECAFASLGDGLTSMDAINLYTAVQRFQTTLGRQV